jgi:hypothetical protein
MKTPEEACAEVHDKWFHSMPVADKACAAIVEQAIADERKRIAQQIEMCDPYESSGYYAAVVRGEAVM